MVFKDAKIPFFTVFGSSPGIISSLVMIALMFIVFIYTQFIKSPLWKKDIDVLHILSGVKSSIDIRKRSILIERLMIFIVFCGILISHLVLWETMTINYNDQNINYIRSTNTNYMIIGQKDNYFITREITQLEEKKEDKKCLASNTKKYIEIENDLEIVKTNLTLQNIILEEPKKWEEASENLLPQPCFTYPAVSSQP